MTVIKHGDAETISLPPMQTLSVVANAASRGRVTRLAALDGSPSLGFEYVHPNASLVYGPYGTLTRYKIECHDNFLTTTVAPVEPVHSVSAPATFVELFGDDAPVNAVRATASMNPTGDDNALTITALVYGAQGNDISIEYVDPAANSQSLAISVDGRRIIVRLATDGSGVITSTAAQVRTALLANQYAARLITAAINTADTGAGDDGSGVVTALARTYLTGGVGTGVGIAGIGSRFTDKAAGAIYVNTGTLAAPVWTELTQAS